jgi:ABC-type microcin C transport system permease subunit YejB
MTLTKRDIADIEDVIADISGVNNPIEIKVFKNNREILDDTQVFKTKNKLIQALKKLDGFEFMNAMNRQIGLKKPCNDNDHYHIQLSTYVGVEYANEINID